MNKIPTLFLRDPGNLGRVLPQLHPDCQWVADGEGVATIKLDGTAVRIGAKGGFWKRRTLKKGALEPDCFWVCEEDPNTGKRFGWVPVTDDDRYHLEALSALVKKDPGTYELCGPKIQGNPEGFESHRLVAHSAPRNTEARDAADLYVHLVAREVDAPRTFEGLRKWLEGKDIEGLVWHHPDGRMAKIKLRDFGFERGEAPNLQKLGDGSYVRADLVASAMAAAGRLLRKDPSAICSLYALRDPALDHPSQLRRLGILKGGQDADSVKKIILSSLDREPAISLASPVAPDGGWTAPEHVRLATGYVAAWNESFPIGTQVWVIRGDGARALAETSGPAVVDFYGIPVVPVDGCGAATELYRVVPLRRRFKRSVATELADAWNRHYGAGTPVLHIDEHGFSQETCTRGPAFVLPAGAVLVQLEGLAGGQDISRVVPVSKDRTPAPLPEESLSGLRNDLSRFVSSAQALLPALDHLVQEQGQPEEISPQALVDLLGLVGVEIALHKAEVWNSEEREAVSAWASATCLAASDNDDLQVPPKPEFLPPPGRRLALTDFAPTPESLVAALGSHGITVSKETASSWTFQQRRQAGEWSCALLRSETDVCVVPPRPDFLPSQGEGS